MPSRTVIMGVLRPLAGSWGNRLWGRLAAGSRVGGLAQPAASRGPGKHRLRQQICREARFAQAAAGQALMLEHPRDKG